MRGRSRLSSTTVAAAGLLAAGFGILGCAVGPDADADADAGEQAEDDAVECTSDSCGGPYGQAALGVTYYSQGDTTNGWHTYDATPAGCSVRVVADRERGSLVVETVSEGVQNGFRLLTPDLKPWGNTTQFHLEWWQKFSTPFVIYVSVNTSGGHRYLQYTATNTDLLGTGQYIHLVYPRVQFGLSRSGQVVTISNQTTGTLTNVSWTVIAVNRNPWDFQDVLLAESTVASGFTWTIPSDLETKYPTSAGWTWVVYLLGTDPFGRSGAWAATEVPTTTL